MVFLVFVVSGVVVIIPILGWIAGPIIYILV